VGDLPVLVGEQPQLRNVRGVEDGPLAEGEDVGSGGKRLDEAVVGGWQQYVEAGVPGRYVQGQASVRLSVSVLGDAVDGAVHGDRVVDRLAAWAPLVEVGVGARAVAEPAPGNGLLAVRLDAETLDHLGVEAVQLQESGDLRGAGDGRREVGPHGGRVSGTDHAGVALVVSVRMTWLFAAPGNNG
jgi:hypothetical protein